MAPTTAEQTLLFGAAAQQLGLISPGALAATVRVWVENKTRPLGHLLRERELLTVGEEQLLLSLLDRLLQRHKNDSLRLLSLLLPPGVIDRLTEIDEPEVRDCLTRLASVPSAPTVFERLQTPTVDFNGPSASTATVLTESSVTGSSAPAASWMPVRYRRVRTHARGGLGEVYLAHDEELQREVALKEMQAQHLDRADCRARFLLEAEITGRLEHPGIVPVYGLGLYPDGRPFYAMRFIRGESLEQALRRYHGDTPKDPGERALELRQLLSRFVEVCNAVAYAHSKGVLHRDIKPENIMLGPYGETLVVDWGLAKVGTGSQEDRPQESHKTHSGDTQVTEIASLVGQVIGTPQYMSPEQASGRVDLLSPASDVYSLGATLYTLVTGHRPVPVDPDIDKVLRLVQSGSVAPARQVNPKVPRPLEAICLKAMALRPRDRYDSAQALAADVERWLADEPVTAYREPLWTRLRRWGRRHRPTVIAAGAILATIFSALWISYVIVAREQGQKQQAIEQHAGTLVTALLEANPAAVPDILKGLQPFRDLTRDRLRAIRSGTGSVPSDDPHRQRRHQTRASLALLPDDPGEIVFLRERLLHPELDPEECLLLRDSLASRATALINGLWDEVNRREASPETRFRALVALAHFDPANRRWEETGAMVVAPLLTSDPLHVGIWTRALSPVQQHLVGPLSETFADPLLPGERRVAAIVLREYTANDPGVLVQLLANANEAQVSLLLPRLQSLRSPLLPLLRADLEAKRSPLTEEARDGDARRRANVAVVLALLGDSSALWPLLAHSAHPDARTHIIHLLPALDVDPGMLVERLTEESDLGVRRALVLALGGYSAEQLSRAQRDALMLTLLAWYEQHPDPGLHAAIDWLLRHSWEGTRARRLDWEQGQAIARVDDSLRGLPRGQRQWYVDPQGQTMVVLGPDEFFMGSPPDEPGHDRDEAVHRCRIGRRYALADCEVTVRQFRRFLAENPTIDTRIGWKYSPEDACPVVSVSWYEAAQYCRWLSEQEELPEAQMCFPSVADIEKCKKEKTPLALPRDYLSRTGYRLPTEAEWEYACRAGARTSKPHGVSNELLLHYAWDVRNALARTWPVGQKKPNDFGLFDMHGNAGEWCLNLLADYPSAKPDEAFDDIECVKEIRSDSQCILRGAPFHPRPAPLRTAYRYWHLPSDRFSTVGLRVARTVK
jgi:serine/threonine protein kinase/formylglycine-generating enzyme required for sulfatase activity